jgi:FkbM family methyltransferase
MRSLNVKAPAPIALFAYRRPRHLRRTLEALRANPEAPRSELHIFCDGPRDGSVAEDVEAVRELALGYSGFAATRVICRDSNYGLARNITEGVSEVLKLQETVIIVEDDIVVSPFFLRFMNDALRLYRDEPRVGSVSGYCYPVSMPVPETYFIPGADCWGWATWRDRWRLYNPDGKALLAELGARNLEHAFDFDGAAGFVAMLKDQIAGKNDSWAIRWHASCFLRDLLILYPGRPLAQNIGHDGSGTHSLVADDSLNVHLSSTPISLEKIAAEESREGRAAICDFLRRSAAPTLAYALDPTLPIDGCDPASISRRPFWRRIVRRALPEFLIRRMWQLRQLIRAPSRLAVPNTSASITSEGDDHLAAGYWGLHELDRQIEKYLDFDDGYFVELGANDGRFQSNTLYYEQSRGWRGILIEPAPVLCRRCRENRSRANHVVNAACVSFAYPGETVELIYSNAMSVSLHVETDLVDPAAHAELGRQFLPSGETPFNFRAPARTLNSILAEANAPRRIDFLSLDVEGAEIEVLRGIDHEAFRFRYLLIECRDIVRLTNYLKTERYRLVDKFNEHDYLFASDG